MKKRILAAFLAAVMLAAMFAVVPVGAEKVKGDWGYYVLADGTACISNYLGTETDVTVPGEIDGRKVTMISSDSVWASVFGEELESVTVPFGVTSIGMDAFQNCKSLKCVSLPDGLESIGFQAFAGCVSLDDINLPDSVIHIYSYSFYNSSLFNDEANWEDGVLYIGRHLISAREDVSGDYSVKPGTVSIADNAFNACVLLTSVTIPDSVTSLGRSAFSGCTSLADIKVSDSIMLVGNSAFHNTAFYNNNTNWEDGALYIGNKLIKVREDVAGVYEIKPGTVVIADYAFSSDTDILLGQSSLTSVIIPDSVKIIGEFAFNYCRSLKDVTIPKSITTVGDGLFYYCESLESITLPSGLFDGSNGFNYSLFSGCGSLVRIDVDPSDPYFQSIDGVVYTKDGTELVFCPPGLKDVVIPDGVTSIRYGVFSGRSPLADAAIPDSVTHIEGLSVSIQGEADNSDGNAEYSGRRLVSVSTDTTGSFEIKPGTLSISYGAFGGCQYIESVTIPDTVVYLDADIFYGCTSLKTVTIPHSVQIINGAEGVFGFYGMKTLLYDGTEEDWNAIDVNRRSYYRSLDVIFIRDLAQGDSNGDGKINAKDVTAIMKYLVGSTPDVFVEATADFDSNGKINAKDVTSLMKYIVANV